MLRTLFLLLCIQLFALTAAQAKSHDYVLERAYFEDPSNSLSFAEVQNKAYTPYTGLLSKGYSTSTFWVRLKIAPVNDLQDESLKKLVLRIQPTYLDEIELFDPLANTNQPRVVGDRYPFDNNEYQSLTFNFMVPSHQEARHVWLRLKTTSTNLMQVRALDLKDTKSADHLFDFLAIGGSAMLIIFLIWSGLHWLLFRDRLVGIFFIRQIVAILFFASYIGYFRVFLADTLAPSQLDYLLSLLVISTSLTGIWFHVEFFREYKLHRYFRYSLNFMMAFFPLELLLMFNGHIITALKINMLMILIIPIYLLFIAIFGISWKKLSDEILNLPKKSLIFFHAIYVLITAIAAIPSLGFSALTELAPHTVLLHGVVTGLVLLLMLLYRSKRMQQKNLLKVVMAHQDVVNEKKRREEQGHFLEMLTHEFKTSLAVLRLSLAKVNMGSKEAQYAEQAIASMNDVIERCGQVQALDDGQIKVEKTELNIPALLKDLVENSREHARINLTAPPHQVLLKADEKLLKVIFSNLLDNACKYSKANSEIEVMVEVQPGQVIVKFENQVGSAGVPDKNMVFEKYYRSPKAHQQVGSGLGLYLTNKIARMMGAELRYIPSNSKVSFELCLTESI
jgi:two-component system, sensor histidine kinase LadS